MPIVSTTGSISVVSPPVKKSSVFTCVGWILDPVFDEGDSLIMLAVSDLSGTVGDQALKMEIIKDGREYLMQFSNARTKSISKTTGVFLNDKKWHFLSYVCTGEGNMKFYADGIEVPAEDLFGDEGLPYSVAWSRSTRLGGGDVWCPYLYKAGQAVSLYNWRYVSGTQIHQQWIQELMAKDLPDLQN